MENEPVTVAAPDNTQLNAPAAAPQQIVSSAPPAPTMPRYVDPVEAEAEHREKLKADYARRLQADQDAAMPVVEQPQTAQAQPIPPDDNTIDYSDIYGSGDSTIDAGEETVETLREKLKQYEERQAKISENPFAAILSDDDDAQVEAVMRLAQQRPDSTLLKQEGEAAYTTYHVMENYQAEMQDKMKEGYSQAEAHALVIEELEGQAKDIYNEANASKRRSFEGVAKVKLKEFYDYQKEQYDTARAALRTETGSKTAKGIDGALLHTAEEKLQTYVGKKTQAGFVLTEALAKEGAAIMAKAMKDPDTMAKWAIALLENRQVPALTKSKQAEAKRDTMDALLKGGTSPNANGYGSVAQAKGDQAQEAAEREAYQAARKRLER
jgi:hypothetical protein